jgi:hypothetical protein
MGELVDFSGQRKKASAPATEREAGQVDDVLDMMSDILLGGAIKILSLDALYDEDRTLIAGHSFAEDVEGAPDSKVRMSYKLLFAARRGFILANVTEDERRNALRALYEIAWDKTFDLGDEDFRLEIENIIGASYGLHNGGRILEALYLKRGISDTRLQVPAANVRELFPKV